MSQWLGTLIHDLTHLSKLQTCTSWAHMVSHLPPPHPDISNLCLGKFKARRIGESGQASHGFCQSVAPSLGFDSMRAWQMCVSKAHTIRHVNTKCFMGQPWRAWEQGHDHGICAVGHIPWADSSASWCFINWRDFPIFHLCKGAVDTSIFTEPCSNLGKWQGFWWIGENNERRESKGDFRRPTHLKPPAQNSGPPGPSQQRMEN